MSEAISVGALAPDFSLVNDAGTETSLSQLKGKWVVLYFYPKDNTPGCTTEAVEFTELKEKFEQLGATVIGVSPDSVKSHDNFRTKHSLKVALLSDPETTMLQSYGAWQKKVMCGRESMGVVRSTVLVDPKGVVAAYWPKVKAAGHAAEVLKRLQAVAK